MNAAYIASIINSTLRSTTPILLAALGCAICSRVGVFNIALEAQMLIASFFSIVVDYFTANVWLSVLAGIVSGSLVGLIVAVLQVKYRAADMVIGTSLNLLVSGANERQEQSRQPRETREPQEEQVSMEEVKETSTPLLQPEASAPQAQEQ